MQCALSLHPRVPEFCREATCLAVGQIKNPCVLDDRAEPCPYRCQEVIPCGDIGMFLGHSHSSHGTSPDLFHLASPTPCRRMFSPNKKQRRFAALSPEFASWCGSSRIVCTRFESNLRVLAPPLRARPPFDTVAVALRVAQVLPGAHRERPSTGR